MIKVGITGQSGFIGSHLFNYLGLKEGIKRINFDKSFFGNQTLLQDFVKNCDVIVHIAGMNRHDNPQIIYDTNIELIHKLIDSCDAINARPKIIFSSSTQEERDNLYGKSKLEGRLTLEKWAEKVNTKVTTLIIPNTFGPFGKPYYNSVIATFCYQLTHGEEPQIQVDVELKLIFINEIIEEFYAKIKYLCSEEGTKSKIVKYEVPCTSVKKVSEVLKTLKGYKINYFDKGIMPNLMDSFELNLFNTFRCYISPDYFPCTYTKHTDERGAFVEIVRANTSGQFSYSTTNQGITRGNHFHTRKAERFSVISGRALIQLRKIGTTEVINYKLDGITPSFVDIPIWHTHNITNIGDMVLITLFWINEPFDSRDSDTYFETV